MLKASLIFLSLFPFVTHVDFQLVKKKKLMLISPSFGSDEEKHVCSVFLKFLFDYKVSLFKYLALSFFKRNLVNFFGCNIVLLYKKKIMILIVNPYL